MYWFIIIVNQLVEQHRIFNLLTLIAFLDYDKAFGNIIRNKLWQVKSDKGFEHLVGVVQILYRNTKTVSSKVWNSKTVRNKLGSEIMVPIITHNFNVRIDNIVKQWQKKLTTFE
jgi:hypothetical protein